MIFNIWSGINNKAGDWYRLRVCDVELSICLKGRDSNFLFGC